MSNKLKVGTVVLSTEQKPCNGCIIANCELCPHLFEKLEEVELELGGLKIED